MKQLRLWCSPSVTSHSALQCHAYHSTQLWTLTCTFVLEFRFHWSMRKHYYSTLSLSLPLCHWAQIETVLIIFFRIGVWKIRCYLLSQSEGLLVRLIDKWVNIHISPTKSELNTSLSWLQEPRLSIELDCKEIKHSLRIIWNLNDWIYSSNSNTSHQYFQLFYSGLENE